ncbi:helix-turn-helix transcriptional regulator [Zunongwangia endophytica]|uniref:Helix-turn-helix transcriptional regulator n=1 Tax=Zunongwangia endophytica TaxID=1808945 RepID=A0ABV8HBJ5_9FLAO|nr:helix-turn-helix domain-containing protein [Zunongwangia endophytica]MDN3594635.1 helix-turn-helix domain-containing protein [Zunongwangia endophytica]
MSTNIRIEKICEYCNKEFVAKTLKTKYCGHTCNNRAYKAKKREEKLKQLTTEKKDSTLPIPSPSLLHTIQDKQILTVNEVAKLLRLSKATVYRIIKEGKLNAVKFSERNTRIYRSEIDLFDHKSI